MLEILEAPVGLGGRGQELASLLELLTVSQGHTTFPGGATWSKRKKERGESEKKPKRKTREKVEVSEMIDVLIAVLLRPGEANG